MGRYITELGFRAEGRFQREREEKENVENACREVTLHALGKKISCDLVRGGVRGYGGYLPRVEKAVELVSGNCFLTGLE